LSARACFEMCHPHPLGAANPAAGFAARGPENNAVYGLLAGCQCLLSADARKVWRRYMCGLCESLARGFGPAARLLATPDAAILSLLVEAQAPSIARSPSRCLLRRPFYVKVPATSSAASRFARAIAVSAAAARLDDAALDGDMRPRWLARLAGAVLRPAARRARGELLQLGFNPAVLAQAQRDAVEAERFSHDFDALSAPVERAYASIFGHTSALAGEPGGAAAGREMGRWFGRLTYLTDAQADYTQDLVHRRFNPLAACFARTARAEGSSLAQSALQNLREAVARLDVRCHRHVLDQLVSGALTRKIALACGKSSGKAGAGKPAQDEFTASGKRPFWRRWGGCRREDGENPRTCWANLCDCICGACDCCACGPSR